MAWAAQLRDAHNRHKMSNGGREIHTRGRNGVPGGHGPFCSPGPRLFGARRPAICPPSSSESRVRSTTPVPPGICRYAHHVPHSREVFRRLPFRTKQTHHVDSGTLCTLQGPFYRETRGSTILRAHTLSSGALEPRAPNPRSANGHTTRREILRSSWTHETEHDPNPLKSGDRGARTAKERPQGALFNGLSKSWEFYYSKYSTDRQSYQR